MPPTVSWINDPNDRYQGNNHRRKFNPCKPTNSKSYGGVSLTVNADAGQKGNYFDLPPRTVGEDGHYFECVVCDTDGELLCCDTCPRTYHLQCVNPPLESVPPGIWQCKICCQGAELLAPLSSFRSSKRKVSSDKMLQKPPSGSFQSLHGLAEAGDLIEKTPKKYVHIDGEQDAAYHIGHERRSDTSAMKEIKVYRRRARKQGKEEENDPKNSTGAHGPSESANKDKKVKLTTDTSGLFGCSIIQSEFAEPADKVLKGFDLNSPQESNPEPEAEGNETVHQAMTTGDCSQIPNINQYNKLWLLRDFMQESMMDQHSIQNNGMRELYRALPLKDTESAKAKREKYARLRARQKQKIALRNRSKGPILSSRIVKHAPLLQMGTEAIDSVRVHTSENEAIPMKDRLLYKSAGRIYSHLTSSQIHSGLRDPRRFQYRQSIFRGKLPVFSSHQVPSTRFSLNSGEVGDRGASMHIPSLPPVPQGGKNHPWISLGSNLASTSQLSKNVDGRMLMSDNSIHGQVMVNCWSEEELDSLWIGVRRYKQRNWEAMLKDSSLSFSEHKTAKDLSQRWKLEKLTVLTLPDLATQGSANPLSTYLRLNCLQVADTSLPSFKDQLPSNQGNTILVGGLINIHRLEIDLKASIDGSQIRGTRGKETSSEGTVRD